MREALDRDGYSGARINFAPALKSVYKTMRSTALERRTALGFSFPSFVHSASGAKHMRIYQLVRVFEIIGFLACLSSTVLADATDRCDRDNTACIKGCTGSRGDSETCLNKCEERENRCLERASANSSKESVSPAIGGTKRDDSNTVQESGIGPGTNTGDARSVAGAVCGACESRAAPLMNACKGGSQSGCFMAAATACQCYLDAGGCGTPTATLQQCVATNSANAASLNSNGPVFATPGTVPRAGSNQSQSRGTPPKPNQSPTRPGCGGAVWCAGRAD